jgi:hypothetical protein
MLYYITILVPTACYFIAGLDRSIHGQWGTAVMWTAYACANLGLLWQSTRT